MSLGGLFRAVLVAAFVLLSVTPAQQLADDGHQVLLFPGRFGDPSMLQRMNDADKFDLDVLAAAQELSWRGATSIVAGGDATVAAGAVLVIGLLGALLVFRLKNNRARAVSGDEAR